MATHRRRWISIAVLSLVTILVVTGGRAPARADASSPAEIVQRAWGNVQSVGTYRFDSDVTQTLIPRAVLEMAGQQETALNFSLDGAVQLPDRAYVEVRADVGSRSTPALVLLRDGGQTYITQDGKLQPSEDPVGLVLPEPDALGYLGAAENVRPLEDVTAGGQTLTRFAFDINGPLLAERARAHAQEALRARPDAPEGATVATSPVLQRLSGQGEVWLNAEGLPVRQVLDLTVPAMSDIYDARLHMVVDLRDYGLVQALPRAVQGADGAWHLEGAASVGPEAGPSAVDAVPGSSAGAPELTAEASARAAVRVSPTVLGQFLLVLGVLALARGYRRNRRHVYAVVAVITVVAMVIGPLLQSDSLIRFMEHEVQAASARAATAEQALQALGLAPQKVASRPAPELDLTLDMEAVPAQGRAGAASVSLQWAPEPSGDYVERCGQGSPTADADGDGLNDQLEGCLGTDPYEADTDQDGLSDATETAGFDYGDRHWVLNPKATDSNGDGQSDYEELSTDLGGLNATLDTDGDGVPDPWDDDNDGDGVPDHVDLSSQAVSPYATTRDLSIQGGSFDGYQYIEFQVQPEDVDHLRYSTTALDWPFDDQGNVQDLDNSTDDVRLIPFMFVTANVVPSELTREYGVRIWQTGGEMVMLVPLQPVSEGGHTMAFYGKVAYAPDQTGRTEHISWRMQMVWMVQATLDSLVAGEVVPDTSVLNQFVDPFRFSGLRITRSRGYEVGLFGTPSTPVEDCDLFMLRQGLVLFYLGYQELEFQEASQTAIQQLQARLTDPATPITYTWGVPGDRVAMARALYPHRDAGLAGIGGALAQDFLNSHYGYDLSDTSKLAMGVDDAGESYYFKATSLLLATEEEAGALDLADVPPETENTLTISLSDVPLITARSVKLVMYEQLESGLWQMMAPSRLMQVVELRYRALYDGFANADYPDLAPDDYRFITYLSYLAAHVGYTVATAQDGQPLTDLSPAESELGVLVLNIMNTAWAQSGYFMPNYVALATGLGGALNGLRNSDWFVRLTQQQAPGFIDEFAHLTPDVFAEAVRPSRLQVVDKWMGRVSLVFGAVVGAASLVMSVLQMACGSGEDFACGNEQAFTIANHVINVAGAAVQAVCIAATAVQMAAKTLEAFKGITAGMAVVGMVIGIGVAWVAFGLAIAGSDSPVVIKAAVALVIVTTIWLIFLFAINFIPVVGQIISAILCLIDTLISLITGFLCGDDSWSVARILTELFYSVEVLTSLVTDPSPQYSGWQSGLRDAGEGLMAGNALVLSGQFAGQMKKESGASDDDLARSWVKGGLRVGPSTQGAPVEANSPAVCTTSNGVRYCQNVPSIIFGLPEPRINNRLQFEAVTTFQYAYAEYALYGAVRYSTKTDQVHIPDEGHDYNDLYVDVQPVDLNAWWTWEELANPDGDGDGLTDVQEATLGTDARQWDSDGDGLSDAFEDERRGDGFDPLNADADEDGLHDGIEFRLGTQPNEPDSDQDGLWDGEEVHHQKVYDWDPCSGAVGDWVGGWEAVMVGGETVWVTSDPLSALTDADPLDDLAERENAFSPWARNDTAALTLAMSPWASGANARPGVFVSPGQDVSMTLALAAYGSVAVTDTLTLCIPDAITGLSGGALSGDRPMEPVLGTCEGGTSYSWSFAGEQTLQLGEQVTTTLSGTAIATDVTVRGEAAVTLPYSDTTLTQVAPVVVDTDVPAARITAPDAGALLRGTTYVVGGSADDPSSWVSQVELGVGPEGGDKAFLSVTGTEAWAYAWTLPSDGRYELQARATDYVGNRALSGAVRVMVDNAPPTVSITTQGAVAATGQTITLEGTATDALSGIARVQLSINGQPWRTVPVTDPGATDVTWAHDWTVGGFAQGKHRLAARAWDRAGNLSAVTEGVVVVDTIAPASALTDQTYLAQSPARQAGLALTLTGVANDAGNAPLPSIPRALNATMDVLDDTTLWLGIPAVADGALGATLAWLGDINSDRMADLAVGLPAAADYAGQVRIVYGRAGDWAVPPEPEMLTEHTTALTGEPGRGLGALVSSAGDANGDGIADVLVGEGNAPRAFLLWGVPEQVASVTLSTPGNGFAVQLDAPEPITGLNWAGDTNDDGLDDLLVLTGGDAYLLWGRPSPWPLYVDVSADAAVVFRDILAVTGLGDVDGDLIGDLAATRANAVDLYLGSATPVLSSERAMTPVHTFTTADAAPALAPLGDTSGDAPTALADWAFTDGATLHIVLGRSEGGWSVSESLEGLEGLVAGVGDVNADGKDDLLARWAGTDDVSLRYGGSLATHRATFAGVEYAPTAPYSAAADLNADGSADMVFIPADSVATERGYGPLGFEAAPFVSPNALTVGAETLSGAIGEQDGGTVRLARTSLLAGISAVTGATHYVDDDGSTPRCPGCINTIQGAINVAASGDTVVVYPGVYAPFSIGSGKDNLTIRGTNADGVFVDGGLQPSAAQAISLNDVDGVSLSHMTLRNAPVGIRLNLAGVGGNGDSSLMNTVDHVASTCAKGVVMDSSSTLSVTHSTLAASTQHIQIQPSSMTGDWAAFAPTTLQTGNGGGLVASTRLDLEWLYAVRGGGSRTIYHADMYAPNNWASLDAPVAIPANSASVATVFNGERNGLMVVTANPIPGVESDITAMTVSGSGTLYAALANGQVRAWNGSTWTTLSRTFGNLGAVAAGNDLYIGAGGDVWKYSEASGEFTRLLHVYNFEGSCQWSEMENTYVCSAQESWSNPASINALLISGSDIYVGGRFNRVGQLSPGCSHYVDVNDCPESDVNSSVWNALVYHTATQTWDKLGGSGYANGVMSADVVNHVVRDMVISEGYLYLGGKFDHHPDVSNVTSPHLIRMRLSDMAFESCSGGLAGSDHQVLALAELVDGTTRYLLVGGSFDTVGPAGSSIAASNIARYRTATSAWASEPGISTNGTVRDIAVMGTNYYLAGDFTGYGTSNLTVGNRLAKYGAGTFYSNWSTYGADARVNALAVIGNTLYAGGSFTRIGRWEGRGRATRFSFLDEGAAGPWAAAYTAWLGGSTGNWLFYSPVDADLGPGATMADDANLNAYLALGGGSRAFYQRIWGKDEWVRVDDLPEAAHPGTALAAAWDANLGRIVILAAIGGTNRVYRYDPRAEEGSRWSESGTLPGSYTFGEGASLAWDGQKRSGSVVYALSGGSSGSNSRAFFSYRNGAWTMLGDGNLATTADDDFPVSLGLGGGLVADAAHGRLLAIPGRSIANPTMYRYQPIGVEIPRGRLELANCALVAPEGATSFNWINSELPDMLDFDAAISDNSFVAPSGISYPVSPQRYTGSITLTPAEAAIADTTHGLYRTNNDTLTRGYYTYRGEVYVSPDYCPTCANDGRTWGYDAFGSVQAAIDSGARVVRLLAGTYPESLQLLSGVALYGAGAELTVLRPTASNAGAVIKGQGVTNVSLVGLSVVGDGHAEGIRMSAGVQAALVKRAIVRGASTGIHLDGSSTDVQVQNCDLVGNDKGLVTTNRAALRLRNAVVAHNTSYGVQYDQSADVKSHSYNDYWLNGTDLSPEGAGAGELFLEPLFTDAAGHNYRPLATSPLIDAGAISDPVPTGAGGRIDIGYHEYGAAGYYASPSYCGTCANDGLDWQVNAFNRAQDALDAAAVEVRALATALDPRLTPLVTVSMAGGTYDEGLSVPSYVHLVGAGATETIVNTSGDYALRFDGVVAARAEGLRLSGATSAGLLVTNASTAISVTRAILAENAVGARFDARASGSIDFCTVVDNTGAGVMADAAHTRAIVHNSLIAGNAEGLVSSGGGLVPNDYNLLHNTTDVSGVAMGANTITAAPELDGHFLTTSSPAVDAADPTAEVPAGGGRRADAGWHELLALPIPLYFGAEKESAVTANVGVAEVEVSVVTVADPNEPFTATLPAEWSAATLASPEACVSGWTLDYTPASSGLHRIYARASDAVGNAEGDERRWYMGGFMADDADPLVEWLTPASDVTTSAAAVKLEARAADYLDDGATTRFNVRSVWFSVGDVRLSGEWDDADFDPANRSYRTFVAWAPLGIGTHTVVAWAEDGAGRTASAGSRTITVSSSGHVATVTSMADGGYTNARSLPSAGYARFSGSGEGQVGIAVDGGATVWATLADPNAAVSAWTAPVALSADGEHTITVTPERGTAGTSTTLRVTRDTTAPSLTVTTPQASDYVTRTVRFEGTAGDDGAGLARVEASLDGGYSWRSATVAEGAFTLEWTVDGAQDFDSYPARVRAVDHAGNVQVTNVPVTVDNTPPTGLSPVTFSTPIGGFVEVSSTLTVGWSNVTDPSGEARVLVDADHEPESVPTSERSGNQVQLTLDALDTWYVHIAARDAAGNTAVSHYGPWYTRKTTGNLDDWRRGIIVDGLIDLASGEWSAATQQLDDDSRSGRSYSLYTVWDGTDFYLGWKGAYWGIDGTLLSYLSLGDGGGTLEPVHPLAQGQLSTPANVCIEITDMTVGALWLYDGDAWAAHELTFVVGPTGDTEVRVPWADMPSAGQLVRSSGGGQVAALLAPPALSLLALTLDPSGNVDSAFPTTNNLDDPLTNSYTWADLGTGDPNAGVPQAKHMVLTVSSPQSGAAAWGPNADIEYHIKVQNLEAEALSDLRLDLVTTAGLGLWSYTGATCGTDSCAEGATTWVLAVPEVAAGATAAVTVTGRLGADLASVDQVTHTITLGADYALVDAPVAAHVTHRVDGKAPTVAFVSPTGVIGVKATTIVGSASDGDGSGVEKVELSVNGGEWLVVAGTVVWSAAVTPAADEGSVTLRARATDAHGLRSDEVTRELAVHGAGPTVDMTMGSLLSGDYALLTGTARDEAGVSAVDVQLDDAEGFWRAARLTAAPAGEAQAYSWTWDLPLEDGQDHQVRVRAVDAVGNETLTEWLTFQVDTIAPVLTAEQVTAIVTATMGVGQVLVLQGTASDGGGVAGVEVRVGDPSGHTTTYESTLEDGAWRYAIDTHELRTGTWRLFVEATDVAGNVTILGPYEVEVVDEPIAGLEATTNAPQGVDVPTVLTATVTAGTNVTYTWDLGDGSTASGSVVHHAYTQALTYTVTVTAVNSVSQASVSLEVLVEVPVSGVVAGNDSPTALGEATALSATVEAGTNVIYDWTFGDGETGSGASVTHTYAEAGTYAAEVTAHNSISSLTATTTVVVDERIAELLAVSDSPTLLGMATTFTTTIEAGTNVTYTWDFGDGSPPWTSELDPTGEGCVVSHTYTALGQYVATVSAINSVSDASFTVPVVILPPYLGYAAFGADTAGTPLTLIDVADVRGQIGANGKVELKSNNTIIGAIVSTLGDAVLGTASQAEDAVRAGRSVVLGNKARAARDVIAGDNVSLSNQSRVEGDVIAAGSVSVAKGATVVGSITEGASVPPMDAIGMPELSFDAGATDVAVATGETVSLTPDRPYRTVTVRSGGVLVLEAGAYALGSIVAQKDAVLRLDPGDAGTVRVDVAGNVDLKERVRMELVSGAADQVLFRVQGGALTLGKDGTYLGTFLAPYGAVELGERSMLLGALYGKTIRLNREARVEGRPAVAPFHDLWAPVIGIQGVGREEMASGELATEEEAPEGQAPDEVTPQGEAPDEGTLQETAPEDPSPDEPDAVSPDEATASPSTPAGEIHLPLIMD